LISYVQIFAGMKFGMLRKIIICDLVLYYNFNFIRIFSVGEIYVKIVQICADFYVQICAYLKLDILLAWIGLRMCFNFYINDIGIYMMYDRLTGWWIIDYKMLRCYGWNQDIIFLEKKNTRVEIIRMYIVIVIRLEGDILTLMNSLESYRGRLRYCESRKMFIWMIAVWNIVGQKRSYELILSYKNNW